MASEGQQAAAAGLYEQALDLYRGDFLAGSSEHWLLDQREWLRSMAMRAITQLTRQALAREQLDAVLNYSRRALDIDHYNEGVYRTLMFVHARRGETAQVERWHQLCTSRLRQHFDVSPSPATQRLLHAALRGEFVDEGLLALA
jgi:DNA-binding SARP family transcriptional activator